MRFASLLAFSVFAALTAVASLPPEKRESRPHAESPPAEMAPPPRERYPFSQNHGFVTSIEKDHIRVQGFDIRIKGSSRTELTLRGRRLVEVKTGPDMTILGSFPTMHGIRSETDRSTFLKVTHSDGSETELRVCEQPHRKYLLSDVLRAGYPGVGRGTLETYRITDVRIGDEIEMSVQDNLFADPVCDAILICARPGGKVPPSPGEAEFRKDHPSSRPLWHERRNAQQDWEERGIPLPYEFHPGGSKGFPIHPGESWPQLAPPPRAK